MTVPVIAPIVEGHGEVTAVRELISRIVAEFSGTYAEVAQPFRLDSGKMRKPDELSKAIRVQAARVRGRGGVLVLRDGDDSDITCPVELAGSLAPEAGLVAVPVEIVIARHEYEAWFLAAVESLRGHSAVRDDATAPDDPEARRGAKSQLESRMKESYKETLHQAKFSGVMDLQLAADRSRSFRRMIHAVELLLR
ncbi:uncharacterized protein DUF4276 [Streptomyces sp. KhCrAH-43]|uniref:DUF4276 family protein n=1 Tax=unclassified Streptomyces TaxID=2593676 RepID=UPI0003762AA1|nr:DUF4276 family protein [Streptomyces sp. KhCrAH-43]MYS35997.1 DUF4276 family protein [Streptomyces sp. SID4920]MYX70626.1 DUF4276 family protein [Streptomyces sp. SID8373]RAJ55775.1 uncharacterized protein DUF4276 [Streptomyces sp. KhCrAH-43]